MSDLDGSLKTQDTPTINGPTSESGEASKTTRLQLQAKMLVVLSADELATAIAQAHKVKVDPSNFALKSAELILKILPPLYYEPRNEG